MRWVREQWDDSGDRPGKLALGAIELLPYSYFTAISSKGLAIVALRSPP
ncbi:hypothetical protein NG796_07535 [Laspinema sp. A4]|nr:hypothetical protein [Laspinema sp. D2d]MCT7983142.1 hypothetical protein [Laspinema sp. D2d]